MKKLFIILFLLISAASNATYLMHTQDDCGPAALTEALNNAGYAISYDKITEIMKWKEHKIGVFTDLLDTPPAHFQVLKTLGIPYKIVTVNDIKAGEAVAGVTIILIHSLSSPFLQQHYVVLRRVDPVNNKIIVQWGDGTDKQFSFDNFQNIYSIGGPTNTAYQVGEYGKQPKKIWQIIGTMVAKFMRWAVGRK